MERLRQTLIGMGMLSARCVEEYFSDRLTASLGCSVALPPEEDERIMSKMPKLVVHRFASGGAGWEVRLTPSGITVYMVPGASSTLTIIPVAANVVNIIPERVSAEGELLPLAREKEVHRKESEEKH